MTSPTIPQDARRTLTDAALLAIAAQYLRSESGTQCEEVDDTPGLAVCNIFKKELIALKERCDQDDDAGGSVHTAVWCLVEICCDFGVKLGAAVAANPPGTVVPAAAAVLEEMRRKFAAAPYPERSSEDEPHG